MGEKAHTYGVARKLFSAVDTLIIILFCFTGILVSGGPNVNSFTAFIPFLLSVISLMASGHFAIKKYYKISLFLSVFPIFLISFLLLVGMQQ